MNYLLKLILYNQRVLLQWHDPPYRMQGAEIVNICLMCIAWWNPGKNSWNGWYWYITIFLFHMPGSVLMSSVEVWAGRSFQCWGFSTSATSCLPSRVPGLENGGWEKLEGFHLLLTKNAPKSQTINVSSATVTAPMVTASHTHRRTPIHSTILDKTQFTNVCVCFIRKKSQTFTVFKKDNKNLELDNFII